MCAANAADSSAVTVPARPAAKIRSASAAGSGVVSAVSWPWSVARAPAATKACRRRRRACR
jgi:hypothetical protein